MSAPIVLALGFGESSFPTADEPWITHVDLADCSSLSAGTLDSVGIVASALLRNLTGGRYGVRRQTVRPHRLAESGCGAWPFGVSPTPSGAILGSLGWRWADSVLPGILLDAPASVLAVKVDGVTLGPTDYYLYDRRLLVRANSGSWPDWQDLSLPDTAPGTWSIYYESGNAVPPEGVLAAKALGCDLAKVLPGGGGGSCVPPERTTSLTRQGTSITRVDATEYLKDGWTGVRITDLWLASLRARKKQRRASIAGPETIRGARA